MRVNRLTRAEAREETRRRLLAAAAELFAARGFDATTVEDVAEAAGFSKGAVYYNFSSKDDLFAALVQQHIDELLGELTAAMDGASTIEAKLAAAQRVLVAHEQDDEGEELFLEILIQAVRDADVRGTVADGFARMRAAVAELIRTQFGDLGIEPPMDAGALATTIIAAAAGHGLLRAIDPDAVPIGMLPAAVGLVLRPPSGLS